MGVFFNDSISNVVTFLMLVNRNYVICLHLDYLPLYPPPATGHRSGLFFKVACVAESEVAGSCLKKATVQGTYCRMRICPDGMCSYGGLSPGKSSSLESLSYRWDVFTYSAAYTIWQQFDSDRLTLELHNLFFSISHFSLSISLLQLSQHLFFSPLFFRKNNETPLL